MDETLGRLIYPNKVCIYCTFWTTDDCSKEPKSLFIFGDNDVKKGCGGQAVIRYCKNAYGIPTKKFPSNNSNSFYTDAEYDTNCKQIMDSIMQIIKISKQYEEINFPLDGFGTGLARLQSKAPKTLNFLNQMIKKHFGIDYTSIQKNGLHVKIDLLGINM
jgi:hypothetical protein